MIAFVPGFHFMADTEILECLPIGPDPAELLRCVGYPPTTVPSPRVAAHVDRLLPAALELVRPRGTYSIRPVTSRTARSLCVGGATIESDVSEFLTAADRIAVFVATAGAEIGEASAAAFAAGDALAGWLYDAVGSWAAEAAADSLTDALRAQLGPDERLSLRFSPGYCGLDLDQQPTIFSLSQASAIGVSLLPSLMMHPTKSVSGIVGIGVRHRIEESLSPCDRCPRLDCHMRR